MPAYHERIYIFPGQNGQPAWIVDFPLWWDRAEFFKKYGDRRIDTGNPFYVEAWDDRCREAFAGYPHSQKPHMVEAMRGLESMLKTASWVVVESSEWESGLD